LYICPKITASAIARLCLALLRQKKISDAENLQSGLEIHRNPEEVPYLLRKKR
jgi:hypothetical protein